MYVFFFTGNATKPLLFVRLMKKGIKVEDMEYCYGYTYQWIVYQWGLVKNQKVESSELQKNSSPYHQL